jgi:hypothetical protein
MSTPSRALWLTVRRAAIGLLGAAILSCSDSQEPQPPGPVQPGRMRVTISGDVQAQTEWSGLAEFDDRLAADTGEFTLLGGTSPIAPYNSVDSGLILFFDGRLQVDQWTVGRFVSLNDMEFPAIAVALDGPDGQGGTFWGSIPGGTFQIDEATYPPSPGHETGLVRGRLSFRAIHLSDPNDDPPVEFGDTIMVSAEFASHLHHHLISNAALSLEGGPVAGTSRRANAGAADDGHGGLFVGWEADLDGLPAPPIWYDVSHEFRTAVPAVGTYGVSSLTPPQYDDALQWPAVYSALYYRDLPSVLGLSTGTGILTITRYVPPSQSYYGEIHGTLVTDLALWTDDVTPPPDTARATASFAIPLSPLAGSPPSLFFTPRSSVAHRGP